MAVSTAAVNVSDSAGSRSRGAFSKYDKMGEDSGSIGAVAGYGLDDAYIVTEKVHGANFCLIASFVDEPSCGVVDVQFAKRTAILGRAADAEDFYSCRSSGLLRTLAPRAEAVLRALSAGSCATCAVHIYGELFGGSYPHPEVPAVPGLEPVQVGVWYAPDLQFMAFDVAIEEADASAALPRRYLDFHVAREACRSAGLLFAEPLLQGTLAECLAFPIEFESTLPARLGLPPLPGAGGAPVNLAEGVVVRPRREPPAAKRQTSGGGKESLRGLFKRKIPAFSEKRYQNDDWKKGKAGGAGAAPVIGAEELARLEVIALVTEQRLANVLSKTGRVDPANRDGCLQLLEDFKEDVREALGDGEEAAVLRASPPLQAELDALCREVIKTELLGRGRRKGAAG